MYILCLIICLSPKVEINHILQNKLHMSTTMDCLDFNLVCKKQGQVGIIASIFNNSTDNLKHGCDTYWRIKKQIARALSPNIIQLKLHPIIHPQCISILILPFIFKLTQEKEYGALAKVSKKENIESQMNLHPVNFGIILFYSLIARSSGNLCGRNVKN